MINLDGNNMNMSDINWRNKRKTWSEKLEYYVKNVDEGDVVFLVGREEGERREIRSVKFLLRVASPVFERMLSAEWSDEAVIKLPDIQPDIFSVFLELLPRDTINASSIAALNLCVQSVLGLLYVAKKYDVTSIHSACVDYLKDNISIANALTAWEHVQSLDEKELISNFRNFIAENMPAVVMEHRGNFSKETLIQILNAEDIYVPESWLFKGARSWAEFQCEELGMDKTGENIRRALGEALYLIRFPLLSAHDFVNLVRPKGILNPVESLGVLEWNLSTNENRESMEMPEFPFKISHRAAQKNLIRRFEGLGKSFTIPVDGSGALYSCRGSLKAIDIDIKTERIIKVYSFGFHGPTHKSSMFDIKIYLDKVLMLSKKVFALKNTVFHAEFDQPLVIRAVEVFPYPRVSIVIQGADIPQSCAKAVTDDGITFYYNYGRPGPIAKWCYDEV